MEGTAADGTWAVLTEGCSGRGQGESPFIAPCMPGRCVRGLVTGTAVAALVYALTAAASSL